MTKSPSDEPCCDDREPVAPPTKPCGCSEGPPPPGVTRLSVARGNLLRNRVEGNPVVLPAIVVEHGRKRAYADRVEIMDAEGNVVAVVIQDDTVRPAVWIEAMHPVHATVEGAKT